MKGIELEEADCKVGDRVKLHPATDSWMKGDRYGTIDGTWFNFYWVRLDKSGTRIKLHRSLVEAL